VVWNWIRLGWFDLLLAYRRTFIGPFWQSAQLMLWALGLGLVFKPFHQSSIEYIPYLVAGLAVWNFLSNAVISGSTVFVSNAGIILNTPTKPWQHVVRMWTNQNLKFVFQLIVLFPVAIYYEMLGQIRVLESIFGVIYLSIFAAPLIVVAGIANTYMRDVEHMISVVMRFLFFLTPVFWFPLPEQIQTAFVRFNPFYYPLEIVRRPLIGMPVDLEIVAIGMAMLLASVLVSVVMLRATKNRLALWL